MLSPSGHWANFCPPSHSHLKPWLPEGAALTSAGRLLHSLPSVPCALCSQRHKMAQHLVCLAALGLQIILGQKVNTFVSPESGTWYSFHPSIFLFIHSLTCSLIYSFSKYLLSIYHGPVNTLGFQILYKHDKVPIIMDLTFCCGQGRQTIKYAIKYVI